MNLAAGLQHAGEIIERRFGIRHRGDDVLRHHHVERRRRARRGAWRPSRPAPRHWRARARRRAPAPCFSIGAEMIDADDAVRRANSPAAKCRCRRRPRECVRRPRRKFSAASIAAIRPLLENRAEHQVVDRRPARIRLFDLLAVERPPPSPPLLFFWLRRSLTPLGGRRGALG